MYWSNKFIMLRCDVTSTVILCPCNGNNGTDTLLFAPVKVMELPLLGAVTMLTYGTEVSAVLHFLKQKKTPLKTKIR